MQLSAIHAKRATLPRSGGSQHVNPRHEVGCKNRKGVGAAGLYQASWSLQKKYNGFYAYQRRARLNWLVLTSNTRLPLGRLDSQWANGILARRGRDRESCLCKRRGSYVPRADVIKPHITVYSPSADATMNGYLFIRYDMYRLRQRDR